MADDSGSVFWFIAAMVALAIFIILALVSPGLGSDGMGVGAILAAIATVFAFWKGVREWRASV